MLRSRTEESTAASVPPVAEARVPASVQNATGLNTPIYFPDGVVHRVEGAHVLRDALLLLLLYIVALFISAISIEIVHLSDYWAPFVILGLLGVLSNAIVAGQRRQPVRVRVLRMLWVSLNMSGFLAAPCLVFADKMPVAAITFFANLVVAGLGTGLSLSVFPHRKTMRPYGKLRK